MAALKRKHGARLDLDLSAEQLKELSGQFLDIVKRHTASHFRRILTRQLEISVGAVFRSWMGKRAVDYRKQFRITKDMANGTAVSVCTMVFGNMGSDSGTGVGFTRNPAPARTRSTANTWSTPRAKTWSQASARPRRSRKWNRRCRKSTAS